MVQNEVVTECTNDSKCTCGLQFGVYTLSSKDFEASNLSEELNRTSINFHGPAGEDKRIFVKEKIDEIKDKVADYYFDPDCKVIAIPNHFVVPKNPTVLGKEGKKKQDDQILNKQCEEVLHHEIVNILRQSKMDSFVMIGFQSGDCIQQLVKKGKEFRGKDLTKDFNEYEIRIKEILDIEDISKDKLDSCIDEHWKWKAKNLELKDSISWLFKKECFIDFIKFI